ncbi:hypothetical protein BM477_04425 [Boudabousia marimammalium]|uniref:POTRA domain-containing protein n=1 Tax=Boudabousia marimammalium TaxID=156892 RepID=A0A1Q5PP75_9ACTO|nr:hypothetical protein BM477_04425 [Boudabousia marimammalium]
MRPNGPVPAFSAQESPSNKEKPAVNSALKPASESAGWVSKLSDGAGKLADGVSRLAARRKRVSEPEVELQSPDETPTERISAESLETELKKWVTDTVSDPSDTAGKEPEKNSVMERSRQASAAAVHSVTELLGSRNHNRNSKSGQSGTEGDTIELRPYLEERKRAKRRRRYTALLSVAAVLAVFVAAAAVLWFAPMFSLKAEKLSITGATEEHTAKLLADSQPYVGKPLVGISVSQWESKLRENVWVREVEIDRSFPNSASVVVKERVPVVAIKRGGSLTAVDQDATELSYLNAAELELPLLELQTTEADQQRAVLTAVGVISELPPEIRDQVKQYTILSPTNFHFVLKNGAVVKWGSRDEIEFKVRVLTVLLKQPAKIYDVSIPTAPVTS